MLFSAGKDSCMALDWAFKKSYDCMALICSNGKYVHLSDGPEVSNSLAKVVAKKIFNVSVKQVLTRNRHFREDLLKSIDSYLYKNKTDLLITGDLDHPDGIIHYLRKNLAKKYPKTEFTSIGEIYNKNNFNEEKYMKEVIRKFKLILFGIRLPDFKNCEHLVGMPLDNKLIKTLKKLKIDILGEDGEYQSLCVGLKNSKSHLDLKYSDSSIHSGRDQLKYLYRTLNIKKGKFIK